MNHSDLVQTFLKVHKIDVDGCSYQILEDQTVELKTSFVIDSKVKLFPFQFHSTKNCNLFQSNLKSLRGAPYEVHGYFSCARSKNLTSLKYFPKYIEDNVFVDLGLTVPLLEYKYLLFSEIQGGIFTGNSELDLFFVRYQNKKSLISEALLELREIQKRFDLGI